MVFVRLYLHFYNIHTVRCDDFAGGYMKKLSRDAMGFVNLKRLQDLQFDIPPSARRRRLLDKCIVSYGYKGFDYILHKRIDRIALFSQTLKGKFVGYEVVVYKYYPKTEIEGQILKERYAPPKDESWGDYGWTYKDVNRAEAKFDELTEVI